MNNRDIIRIKKGGLSWLKGENRNGNPSPCQKEVIDASQARALREACQGLWEEGEPVCCVHEEPAA
jgi:hypothetical protein